MTRRYGLWPLTALMLGAACHTATPRAAVPTPLLRLTVDRARYRAGDTVSIVLKNDDSRAWFYNLCPYYIQRRDADGWAVVDSLAFAQRICDRALYGLEPGDTRRRIVVLPDTLSAGAYRFRFTHLPAGARQDTPGFVVEP